MCRILADNFSPNGPIFVKFPVEKRERHEAADMALGEAFGRSDFVERCGPSGEDSINLLRERAIACSM